MTQTTAKARYTELAIRRDPFLRRARLFAALTIPSLLPPEGSTIWSQMPETYQSFGARAVVGLGSRLMTAFLPPGQKFFRLQVPTEIILRSGEMKVDPDTERQLTLVEDIINAEVERAKWRQPTVVEMEHLIVTGNVLEQMMPDNTIRAFRLDQYVVARDPQGRVTEIVVEELLNRATLDPDLAALAAMDTSKSNPSTVSLFTWVKWNRNEKVWDIHQELADQIVPDSEGRFLVSPFNAMRWVSIIGEDYGRSKIEEHYGDLMTMEGLSKSLVDGGAMASRNIIGVRPNAAGGLNLRRRLAKARNGDVLTFHEDDVHMLQFDNVAGLQFVQAEKQELRRELAAAFLMNSAAQRDAERVTAFELRVMVEEIESVLGGVFTSLQGDIQENRLRRLMLQMQSQGKLPQWPDGIVEPVILTGLEAISREREAQRANMAISAMSTLPPEVVAMYPKWDVLLGKIFNGLGMSDAVHSEDEVRQMMQQQAAMEAARDAAVRAVPPGGAAEQATA